jgi:ubiquinone/menaquinone biosynthesis C-methylase UbiE
MSLAHYDSRNVHLRYAEARRLPPASLRIWSQALTLHIRAPGARHVADLGCGTGRFCGVLAGTFRCPVVGIDLSEKMLGVARATMNSPSIRLVRADVAALPLADESVDVAFMSMVYHHLPDKPAALAEVRRVLPKGAFLALRTCSVENLDSVLYPRFFPEAREIDRARLEPAHVTAKLVEKQGFTVAAQETVSQIVAENHQKYLQKIRLRASSDLEAITDDQFAAGLQRLAEYCVAQDPAQPVRESIDLFVFRAA